MAPETISRWENGRRDIDRTAFATLGALIHDALADRTDTLDLLRALREPSPLGETVRLDLTAA